MTAYATCATCRYYDPPGVRIDARDVTNAAGCGTCRVGPPRPGAQPWPWVTPGEYCWKHPALVALDATLPAPPPLSPPPRVVA